MTGNDAQFHERLEYLKLRYIMENHEAAVDRAARENWTHLHFLEQLIEGEAQCKWDRSIQRRINNARLPVLKTLDQFQWNWPRKINRQQVQNLMRLQWIKDKRNVILLGGVGLGKTHIATALAHEACLKGLQVFFTATVAAINALTAAQAANQLANGLKKYLRPTLLVLDELGYLPIDKRGADLLFQIISGRYERGATIITSNRAYKDWPHIFNNDATLTSAILDRLLHHAETVVIEGKSYRMKEQIEI